MCKPAGKKRDVVGPRRGQWELTEEWNYIGEDHDVFWFLAQRIDSADSVLMASPHYTVVNGVLHLVALNMLREGLEPVEITAEDVRSVPLSTFHKWARDLLGRAEVSSAPSWPPEDYGMPPDGWLPDLARRQRPERGRRGDYEYAVIAASYVELSKKTETPVKALAAELHLSSTQVRNLLAEARKRKLLEKNAAGQHPGRAYGRLTAKGKEVLDGAR